MELQKWEEGLAGLIYLPQEGTQPGQKKRPFFIYEINEHGQLTQREGPMIWSKARERIKYLAEKEQCKAFSCPDKRRLKELRD